MLLKNKVTGIIGELHFEPDKEYHFTVVTEDPADVTIYKKLADLYADWEDYEEPRKYWFINPEGEVASIHEEYEDEEDTKATKEIGNYFETKEEAEQAVEKLKAWKRLKDNGYEFNGIGVEYDGYKIYLKCDIMKKEHYTPTQDHKDLDLLFGGEE